LISQTTKVSMLRTMLDKSINAPTQAPILSLRTYASAFTRSSRKENPMRWIFTTSRCFLMEWVLH
jgi:hypothetical protein